VSALNESVKLNRQLSVTGLEPSSPSDKSPEKNTEVQKSENHEREVLVKSGFRAIKLVVTDFLATTPSEHLQLIIQVRLAYLLCVCLRRQAFLRGILST
jgi:hypothetical protein